MVKTLDGCAITGHFWVFAAGLTDVEVDLQVLDTQSGLFATYRNPQATPFAPIQDVFALEICP